MPQRILMEVLPGKSIGAFALGMSLPEATQFIQQKNKTFSHVELKYNEVEPLSTDIVLDLNEDGFMLRFEPRTQKLRTIEIYDVLRVTLTYAGEIFSGPTVAPTLVNITERFGPTHPGEYDQLNRVYSLLYPGLLFAFPIPKKYEDLYQTNDGCVLPLHTYSFPKQGFHHWNFQIGRLRCAFESICTADPISALPNFQFLQSTLHTLNLLLCSYSRALHLLCANVVSIFLQVLKMY